MPYLVEPIIADGVMAATDQPPLRIDTDLSLRPFTVDDASAVLGAFSDPDIQLWHGFRLDTLAEATEWIQRTHELWSEEKSVVWAIAGPTDEVLGRCALHINRRQGTAEIAYWVLPAARRRRVAVRAVAAVTTWGHDRLGIRRILLQHSTKNTASCAVAISAGYAVEGTARQQDLHIDGWHDMHQHAHVLGD